MATIMIRWSQFHAETAELRMHGMQQMDRNNVNLRQEVNKWSVDRSNSPQSNYNLQREVENMLSSKCIYKLI